MSPVDKYNKKIREMFFLSVKKDLKIWVESSDDDFFSPDYKDCKFNLDANKKILYFYKNGGNTNIGGKYKVFIFPTDIKMWLYSIKLKRHFKKCKKEKEFANQIDFLKSGIATLDEIFVKEIRKEKLDKLNKL